MTIKLPDLTRTAQAVREMRAPFGVTRQPDKTAKLLARIKQLTDELEQAREAQAKRAHREERVRAITLRVVDNRHAWAAKMGLVHRQPLVAITSQRIVTADVWQQPDQDD